MVARDGIEPPTQGFSVRSIRKRKQLKTQNKLEIAVV